MSAIETLDKSYPSPKWTTEKVIGLAKDILEEVGYINASAYYELLMLPADDDTADEVEELLATLVETHEEAGGKKPPKEIAY